MSNLDKELEAAYAATKKTQEQLERSKNELREISTQGTKLGKGSKTALLAATLTGATIGSGILLYDPDSRVWGYFLIAVLVTTAAWSYFRHWQK